MRSLPQQPLSTGVAERSQRFPATGLCVRENALERGAVPYRSKLLAGEKCGRDEVALLHGTAQLVHSLFMFAHVAEQPAFLEDGFGVVLDLQRAEM